MSFVLTPRPGLQMPWM